MDFRQVPDQSHTLVEPGPLHCSPRSSAPVIGSIPFIATSSLRSRTRTSRRRDSGICRNALDGNARPASYLPASRRSQPPPGRHEYWRAPAATREVAASPASPMPPSSARSRARCRLASRRIAPRLNLRPVVFRNACSSLVYRSFTSCADRSPRPHRRLRCPAVAPLLARIGPISTSGLV